MDIVVLHNEIVNDPVPLGYAGKTDQQIADLMNALTQTKNRDTISADMLIRAFVPADYVSLSQLKVAQLQIILSAQPFSVNDTNIAGILQNIFVGKTGTLNAMAALQTYKTSRADILGLEPVTAGDVGRARSYVP